MNTNLMEIELEGLRTLQESAMGILRAELGGSKLDLVIDVMEYERKIALLEKELGL